MKYNKIIVVGADNTGRTTLTKKEHNDIILIGADNTIEVNGVIYKRRASKASTPMSRRVSSIMMMAQMFGETTYSTKKQRQRPNVIIEKEFALIQQKKSNLSKSDRDWVEHMFHMQYDKL